MKIRFLIALFSLGFAGQAIAQTTDPGKLSVDQANEAAIREGERLDVEFRAMKEAVDAGNAPLTPLQQALRAGLQGEASAAAVEPAKTSKLTPGKVNEIGRGRYTAARDFLVDPTVEFSQPDYKFESALPQGFGKATAEDLGMAGVEFWNEYPGIGGVWVAASPKAEFFYDTVSRMPLYIAGCIREGKKNGLNRVKLVVPSPPPPAPEAPPPSPPSLTAVCSVDKGTVRVGEQIKFTSLPSGGVAPLKFSWSGTGDIHGDEPAISGSFATAGTITAQVAVTDFIGQRASATCNALVEDVPEIQVAAPKILTEAGCPADWKFKAESYATFGRRIPIWNTLTSGRDARDFGISQGIGLGGTTVRSRIMRDAKGRAFTDALAESGAITGTMYYGVRFFFPNHDRFRLEVNGTEVAKNIKNNGEQVSFNFEGKSGYAVWSDDGLTPFVRTDSGKYVQCGGRDPSSRILLTPGVVSAGPEEAVKKDFVSPPNGTGRPKF